jgi:hypothetical protein
VTLLKNSRLHRQNGGTFGFVAPDAKADQPIRNVWKGMETFLAETDAGKKSVEQLFTRLRLPPYGLKDGVLPILLVAMLMHDQTQVALYEEGSFVPKPNAAVLERLMRHPSKFDIQRFLIAGQRTEVFARYAQMIQQTTNDEIDLLTIVRPMVRLVKDLPAFVSKTKQISEYAQKVMHAIREARQPDQLLFVDLPLACGFPVIEVTGTPEKKRIEAYFTQLRTSFNELQLAYHQLITDLEKMVVAAFSAEGTLAMARKMIEHDARLVLKIAVEAKLKAFLERIIDAGLEDKTWLESIATLLVGKPPVHWEDQDKARFEVQLRATVKNFENYRIIAIEMEKSGISLLHRNRSMLLVSITGSEHGVKEKVVQVSSDLVERAGKIRGEIYRVLDSSCFSNDKDAIAAILAEMLMQQIAMPTSTEKK